MVTATSAGTLSGVSVVYNAPTTINTPDGNFDELVAPGALRPALERSDVGILALLRDHDPSRILARLGSGTLKVLDDSTVGLRVLARLAATDLGAETATLIARGDLGGMSFSFVVAAATWYEPATGGENPLRVITAISRMFDVSVVTYPAYPQTTVSLTGADVPARSADPQDQARLARHRRRARAMGSVRPGYGVPMGRPPAAFESWARARPYRVGTSPRRGIDSGGIGIVRMGLEAR